ncbi:unnamed protein product [Symbiodinium sp. CCMP2592]|nr:unnamed protein product [Symbiodinium sp. CCMP2592]
MDPKSGVGKEQTLVSPSCRLPYEPSFGDRSDNIESDGQFQSGISFLGASGRILLARRFAGPRKPDTVRGHAYARQVQAQPLRHLAECIGASIARRAERLHMGRPSASRASLWHPWAYVRLLASFECAKLSWPRKRRRALMIRTWMNKNQNPKTKSLHSRVKVPLASDLWKIA